MKSLLPSTLSLLFIPASLLGQEIEPKTAWQSFQEQFGQDWTVEWNGATDTPRAIYGPGLPLGQPVTTLAAARRESTGLLDRFAALLGRGQSTFVENIGVKANQVYVFVYDQEFRGLPVISGRADVRIHEVGRVAMFGSSAIRVPAGFDIRPTIAAAAARRTADQNILGEAGLTQAAPRLVIWGNTEGDARTTATLAWEVQIDETAKRAVAGKVYIDARKGGVLEFKNEIFNCSCGAKHAATGTSHHASRIARAAMLREIATPTPAPAPKAPRMALTGRVLAWTNIGILPTSPLSNIPMPRLLVTSSAGRTYTDANGNFSIPYSGSAPVTVTATLRGRHSLRVRTSQGNQMVASANVTPGTPATLQFGNSGMGEFNRSQTATYWHVDDANIWVRGLLPGATGPMNTISQINPRVNINDSCNAYYTNNTINFYTAGDGCNMTAYQTVIVHEWGHGLDAVFGGITQTDGLSEGWGDILALYRSRQPELGPGFRVGTTRGIRTGLNTRTYPQASNAGPHTKGQTWMGFAWDLRTNLMSSLGATAGEARAHAIVIASIAANARNQPDAVREVFLLDDNDGNLSNGTPNYLDLEKAALKRTLPYPKRANPDASTFKVFGAGCPGTGRNPAVCLSANASGGSLENLQRTLEYAYRVNNGRVRNIEGVEFFTRSTTGSTITARTAIYVANGTAPNPTPIATGTIRIGTTARFYRSNIFATVPSGFFFVAIDHSDCVLSNLASGATGNGAYYRPPSGGTFAQSRLIDRPSFRVLCAGEGSSGATPFLSNKGVPDIGQQFSVSLTRGKASAPAVFLTGLSNTRWAGGALPWSLRGLGAPGCDLLVDPRFTAALTLNPQGQVTLPINVPNNATYVGLKVYHQWYVVDGGANAAGLAVSPGGESKVGRR